MENPTKKAQNIPGQRSAYEALIAERKSEEFDIRQIGYEGLVSINEIIRRINYK